jgi:hypothetical protein
MGDLCYSNQKMGKDWNFGKLLEVWKATANLKSSLKFRKV